MNGMNTDSVMQPIIIIGDMDKQKKPSNFAVAVHLAKNYRERMKSDEDFKKVAALYNMKWSILKKNFESVCKINDIFTDLIN